MPEFKVILPVNKTVAFYIDAETEDAARERVFLACAEVEGEESLTTAINIAIGQQITHAHLELSGIRLEEF